MTTTRPGTDHPQPAPARTLGFFALFSIAIGLIVSQTSTVSLLQAIGIGGEGFFIAFGIALLLSICNALTFAELSLSLPRQGSIGSYAEVTVGQFPAILAVFAGYVVPAIFGLSAELMLFDSVIGQLFPGLLPNMGWAVVLLATLVALNLAGTDVFATAQQLLTFVIIAFFLVAGLAVVSGPAPAAPAWTGYTTHISIAPIVVLCFWTLIGCEYVTPMVEEARNARRDLPRAMIVGLLAIAAVNLLFAWAAAHVLPRDTLAASLTPHLDVVSAIFGNTGRVLFAVIALTASASLTNTVLGAVPRMLHGMALNGQVFPAFKRVSGRRGVPFVALLFVAACPLVGIAFAQGDASKILPLTIAATVCWMMVYILAHVVLLVLRARRPDLKRPFRTPFYPLPQLAAIAGLAYVICHSSPEPTMTRSIVLYSGSVLALFGIVAALWVKFAMKQPLFAAMPVETEVVPGEVTHA
jgi:amino acid transporter